MPCDKLIDYTLKSWSPRYSREITREERREILANLAKAGTAALRFALRGPPAVSRIAGAPPVPACSSGGFGLSEMPS